MKPDLLWRFYALQRLVSWPQQDQRTARPWCITYALVLAAIAVGLAIQAIVRHWMGGTP